MRKSMIGLLVGVLSVLHGCASTGAPMNKAQQQDLQSLHLFAVDGAPRFTLYVACTSDSVNCVNVESAFSDWAGDHRLTVRNVGLDTPAFASVRSSGAAEVALPYRVAIDYRPMIVAGYSQNSYGQASQSFPPLVGYTATIWVFDAAGGKLLLRAPVRTQQSADKGKTANPFVNAEVNDLLNSLIPATKVP